MNINKPKFWDRKKFIIWPYLFLPLSLIVHMFNLFKFKFFEKKKFNIPIICVGNIYLGGTGKTPLCIEIFKILKSLNANPGFIKKYYEKFIDENKLLESTGNLFLNKNRHDAIKLLISNNFKVAILDDGFQDPTIKSDISIVCFNEKQWIGNGFLIPSGPLRESLEALKRCNLVFINGYKNLEIEKVINKINSKVKIFYAQYKLINLNNLINEKILAFAGIGNPDNFFNLLKENNLKVVKSINFSDHHNFSKKDIFKLNQEATKLNAKLITTEKDYYRLKNEDKKNINFLKIELLIERKNDFVNEIKKII